MIGERVVITKYDPVFGGFKVGTICLVKSLLTRNYLGKTVYTLEKICGGVEDEGVGYRYFHPVEHFVPLVEGGQNIEDFL